MSNIICLILGLIVGAIVCYIVFHIQLEVKQDVINDYKKGINLHNRRELRFIFINQSIKDYVQQQQNILKGRPIAIKDIDNDAAYIAGRYIAFKDIEKIIIQLERNSENLIK